MVQEHFAKDPRC